MYKNTLILFLAVHFDLPHALAQQYHPNILPIHVSGSAELPDELITLQVNINQFHSDSNVAYDRHREQEAYLTNLLLERNIEDKDISASRINIHPSQRGNNDEGYQTRQQVK